MPNPQFRTSKGRLTAYSFICGYRERRSTDRDGYGKDGLDTEIYHDGAIYHVRQHDRLSEATRFRVFWKSYRTLNEARNLFNRQQGKLTN
jgi:hypothetical protein